MNCVASGGGFLRPSSAIAYRMASSFGNAPTVRAVVVRRLELVIFHSARSASASRATSGGGGSSGMPMASMSAGVARLSPTSQSISTNSGPWVYRHFGKPRICANSLRSSFTPWKAFRIGSTAGEPIVRSAKRALIWAELPFASRMNSALTRFCAAASANVSSVSFQFTSRRRSAAYWFVSTPCSVGSCPQTQVSVPISVVSEIIRVSSFGFSIASTLPVPSPPTSSLTM